MAELLHVLRGFNGLFADKDSIRWKHSRDERLSVNKLYIKEVKEHPGGMLGPWKQIWRNKVPTKVKCFSWLVARREEKIRSLQGYVEPFPQQLHRKIYVTKNIKKLYLKHTIKNEHT